MDRAISPNHLCFSSQTFNSSKLNHHQANFAQCHSLHSQKLINLETTKKCFRSHTAAQMASLSLQRRSYKRIYTKFQKKTHMDEDARQSRFLILPIIDLVHMTMKQNIGFRGHRDNEKSDSEDGNIGNFK